MDFPDWLENHTLPCTYRQLFGIECPFCGSQRAFITLLRGNFIESMALYPALIPTIILITAVIIQMLFKFKNGWKIVRKILMADFAIIIVSYIIKLLLVY
ncbi:MAG: DUF2752 domain-containing protein [Bacteroidales bacterium]|nr:MAG: DUF2752 domain-containing protein [Bacteroidales bacterium]